MLKKIICTILIILVLAAPISVSAYEVTGFDITANAGMLISMDTEEILYEKDIDNQLEAAVKYLTE